MVAVIATVVVLFLLATALGGLSASELNILTRSAWTLACLIAAGACIRTYLPKDAHDRVPWLIMGLACCLWAVGNATWIYFEVIKHRPADAHPAHLFFLAYPLLFVIGLLRLPKPPGVVVFTARHLGNLVLIACAVVVCFASSLWEPMMQLDRSLPSKLITLLKAAGLAGMAMTALYLLWGYPWRSTYWPLLLIAAGAATQATAFVTNVHLRMTETYRPGSWYNIGWVLGFGALACAAYERAWQRKHASIRSRQSLLTRERWLEAIVPAALIVLMVTTTWLNVEWLTMRVVIVGSACMVLFAIVLSIRDAWIQREEQRLLMELNASNESLLTANRELIAAELRYRALNAELEKRVTERTIELQSAYRELESFSYAVAHDIKAPLRAVNSFAALLLEEHGKQLEGTAVGYVERMRRGALQMAQLVDDLLAYARVERQDLQLQVSDLRAAIDACIAEQKDEIERMQATVVVEAEPIAARIDTAAFALTMRNLLQNALKFSHRSVPVRIDIAVRRIDGHIRIWVRDNGIGFDMQYHDRIFALFQRLHRPGDYSGTGIGLAIARKAIERMRGRMWAQSVLNEGATFFIELPLVDG
jgi:signal transduction histidine kinase